MDIKKTMRKQSSSDILAVVVHAYYDDVFKKIIQSLKVLDMPIKLYVTTSFENEDKIRGILMSSEIDFTLLPMANRGRDILPFLLIMTEVIDSGHVVLLKLHTKKTTHRNDGDEWMCDILNKLVNMNESRNYFDLIRSNSGIGIIAPEGHVIEMSKYYGMNKLRVLRIVERLGLSESDVNNQVFVAGAMFYAHVAAIKPIIKLAFTSDDFEFEHNQKDGTLAHAIERCFGVSCQSANLKLASSENLNDDVSRFVRGGYAYADATGYGENDSVIGVALFYLYRVRRLIIKSMNIIFRK